MDGWTEGPKEGRKEGGREGGREGGKGRKERKERKEREGKEGAGRKGREGRVKALTRLCVRMMLLEQSGSGPVSGGRREVDDRDDHDLQKVQTTQNLKNMVFDRFLVNRFLMFFLRLDNPMDPLRGPKKC